jgi:ADP-sugar diphosphatase
MLRRLINLVNTQLRTMSSTGKPPSITFAPSVPLTEPQLHSFGPYKTWLSTLQHSLSLQRNPSHTFHAKPYSLRRLEVQAVDFFGKRIGFLKLRATLENDDGESLPGSVFLRGGSVAMLVILQEEGGKEGEEWVLLTVQPRVPAGSLAFVELPAGMIDDDTFSGAAAKEIQEECGIEIKADGLLDLTELALGGFVRAGEERLHVAVYPSPGGEWINSQDCGKRGLMGAQAAMST